MSGEPLPYLPRNDWMVTAVLFGCIVLVSYVLGKERRYLSLQLKGFFNFRERASLFDDATTSDIHYTILLLFHSCLMYAFCIYHYFSIESPLLFDNYPHIALLGLFVIVNVVLLVVKGGLYEWVNWVFFTKSRCNDWLSAYLNVNAWTGLLLLPAVLLLVYFGKGSGITPFLALSVLVLSKILLFYRGFCNFFPNFYGSLHLILYFCTLEILPDLLVWRGILLINDYFILKI